MAEVCHRVQDSCKTRELIWHNLRMEISKDSSELYTIEETGAHECI